MRKKSMFIDNITEGQSRPILNDYKRKQTSFTDIKNREEISNPEKDSLNKLSDEEIEKTSRAIKKSLILRL
jgi:hypothetical protein